MTNVENSSVVSAKVVCDSISSVNGKRLTTFEIEVPRIVWAEFLTHRMISRNAASSRAIPFEKMIENLKGIPSRFGQSNNGMQDRGQNYFAEISGPCYSSDNPVDAWNDAKEDAIAHARAFYEAGYHKQVYNRITEPYQLIKAIATSSEWNNFFWLRDDEAADPTIQELARCMKEAREQSTPIILEPGQWHLPFVTNTVTTYEQEFFIFDEKGKATWLSREDAIIVSCARCAAVSFRNVDYDLAKCKEVYDRLINGGKVHGSALEHCATPMEDKSYYYEECDAPYHTSNWQEGITHMDSNGNFWSGNFKHWIQHRQLIPNESKKG